MPVRVKEDRALEFGTGDRCVDMLHDARGDCAVHFGPKLCREVGMHTEKKNASIISSPHMRLRCWFEV